MFKPFSFRNFALFLAALFSLVSVSVAGERLSADFSQEKTLSGFKTPLRSAGNVVIFSDFGLIWHQLRPFSSVIKITGNTITTQTGKTAPQVTTMKTGDSFTNPQELLKAIFAGDEKALSLSFNVVTQKEKTGKTLLTLTPKNEKGTVLFSEMRILKAKEIESVTMKDIAGNVTTISFTNTVRKKVTDSEAQREFDAL